jgi:hypothetical protein
VLTSTPETSREIVWSAPLNPIGSLLEYRKVGGKWASMRAVPEAMDGCEAVWAATITGLKSGLKYEYRVSGASAQGRVWSEIFALRTGPVSLRDRFKVAFFASNGVDGSGDSTQAKEVLTMLKKGGYPLVLGGGGYALSARRWPGSATSSDEAVRVEGSGERRDEQRDLRASARRHEVESFAHAERAADYAEFMSRLDPAPP